MKSLRAQLLLGMTLGTSVVWVISGGLLLGLISRMLWSEFDEALAAKARSLAALADQDEEGLDFELLEISLPEFAAAERAEYYQIWRSDGSVFARSPSLGDRNLDRLTGANNAAVFRTVELPDGRAGRVVSLTFVPRQDFKAENTALPLTVTLVLGRELAGLESTLARVRRILIGVCFVAIVSSCGVLAWVVRRSLKPVQLLTTQISDVGENELSTRIDAAGIPMELLPVVDRLNELLVRLHAAFQRERRFTGDVAHELRTPLAGLRTKLELALSRDRDANSYRKTVDDCLGINLQMQRMVENLLHLARADAGQLEVRREPVALHEIVRECWRPLDEKAHVRGLRVQWCLNTAGLVETDRDKLQLVIRNVLDNAVSYADDKAPITISTWAQNGALGLAVRNTGSSLTGDQVRHVFDRFWRGDSSTREPQEAHCGLGLPLCKAVMERLGGSIAASTGSAGEFTITIRFPP